MDRFQIYLTAPDGTTVGPFYEQPPAQRYLTGRTELLVYYGEPGPYSVDQEIFIEMIPLSGYIDAGVCPALFPSFPLPTQITFFQRLLISLK